MESKRNIDVKIDGTVEIDHLAYTGLEARISADTKPAFSFFSFFPIKKQRTTPSKLSAIWKLLRKRTRLSPNL